MLSNLIRAHEALQLSGTPYAHGRAFQNVCNKTQNVIMLRCVGPKITGLIQEGYATKSFHIKSKSCSWGPMAGFVCKDSRFSKSTINLETMHGQTESTFSSLLKGKLKGLIPLCITTERIEELETKLNLIRVIKSASNAFLKICETISPGGRRETFILKYNQPRIWKIKYLSMRPAYGRMNMYNQIAQKYSHNFYFPYGQNFSAPLQIEEDDVLSVIDSMCPSHLVGTYRSATISDYDLFSVFPPRDSYRADLDARIVPGSLHGFATKVDFAENMDPNKGNITPRINLVIDILNQEIKHKGGTIVHHGDEAGRPSVKNIDFPFICFLPQKAHVTAFDSDINCYLIQNIDEYKRLFLFLKQDYVLNLNPGWFRDLGIMQSAKGYYEY